MYYFETRDTICYCGMCPFVPGQLPGGGVTQWVALLARNVEVVGSSPIKGPRCFLEQETVPLLLSTGSMNGFERDFTTELK